MSELKENIQVLKEIRDLKAQVKRLEAINNSLHTTVANQDEKIERLEAENKEDTDLINELGSKNHNLLASKLLFKAKLERLEATLTQWFDAESQLDQEKANLVLYKQAQQLKEATDDT